MRDLYPHSEGVARILIYEAIQEEMTWSDPDDNSVADCVDKIVNLLCTAPMVGGLSLDTL